MAAQSRARNAYMAEPGAPWEWPVVTASAVTVTSDLGRRPYLVYGSASRRSDPRGTRDPKGRSLLEAFTALPLEQAIDDFYGAVAEGRDERAALAPVLGFIATFGPFGVRWGRLLPVWNKAADEAMRRAPIPPDDSWEVLLGGTLATPAPHARSRYPVPARWVADFTSASRSRGQSGNVRLLRPGEPDWERADVLPDVERAQAQLRSILTLSRAMLSDDGSAARSALVAHLGEHAELLLDGPGEPDWRLAVPGRPSAVLGRPPERRRLMGRTWQPFLDRGPVDWIRLAELVVRSHLARQLSFVEPVIGEGFTMRFSTGSLIEYVYLELRDHLAARPVMGITICSVCDGHVLQTRQRAPYRNRWHQGCRKTGQGRLTRGSSPRVTRRRYAPRDAAPGQRFSYSDAAGTERELVADERGVVQPQTGREALLLAGFGCPMRRSPVGG